VATGCFISTGRSLDEALERVKLAESLGYETVYVTHILEELTAVDGQAQIQAGLQRYREAGATSPCVGPTAKSDFEATLRAGIGV
jgi:hypothetical protein